MTPTWPQDDHEWTTNFPRFPCGTARLPDEPEGYNAWADWAEQKLETHRQKRCPMCRLWHVWISRDITRRTQARARLATVKAAG